MGAIKKRKRVKYSKAARERIRRRRQLLQEEFNREGLNLIATFKDVTNCPLFKERLKLNEPKITASEIMHNRFELRDFGESIQLTRCSAGNKSPVIDLVTPPHSGSAPENVTLFFPPGRRTIPAWKADERIFICSKC